MTDVAIFSPVELETKIMTVPDQARALAITDDASLVRAGDILVAIKGLRAEIDAAFDPIIQKAHAAHKEALSQKKKADDPLVEAEGIIKPRIAAYQAEQERIRREDEARLRAEAERAEEERRIAEAIALEESGDAVEAEAVISAPVVVPRPVIPPAPKLAGISTAQVWKYEITDMNKVPREYLKIDEVKVGGVVRALKDAANIPGIRIYTEASVRASGRRTA